MIASRLSRLCGYGIRSRHRLLAYGQTVSDLRREVGISFNGLRPLRDLTPLFEFIKGQTRIDVTAFVGQLIDVAVE